MVITVISYSVLKNKVAVKLELERMYELKSISAMEEDIGECYIAYF